jgi:hypothetical protein
MLHKKRHLYTMLKRKHIHRILLILPAKGQFHQPRCRKARMRQSTMFEQKDSAHEMMIYLPHLALPLKCYYQKANLKATLLY